MKDYRVIFHNPDTGIAAVLVPAPEMFDPNSKTRKLLEVKDGLTFASDEEVLSFIIAKDLSEGADFQIVHVSELPQDRYFRNSWKYENGKVSVDMAKAKDFHLSKIREARDRQLEKLDKDFNKYFGQKKQQLADQVEAQRQQLRDIPQTFDLSQANSPKELKALWPDGLPKV